MLFGQYHRKNLHRLLYGHNPEQLSKPVCAFSLFCRDLFNAAFLSCWSELSEDQQDELIRSIELALTSQDIAEVTQTLLNLAEFMEHSDKVSNEVYYL